MIARNYSQNLGEETRTEKALNGIYPSFAPVGLLNTTGPNHKKIIVSDPDTAPSITELFDRFAKGEHSIKRLAAAFRSEGRTLRGRVLSSSLLQTMRRILIDYARARIADKRGGSMERVSLSAVDGWFPALQSPAMTRGLFDPVLLQAHNSPVRATVPYAAEGSAHAGRLLRPVRGKT